MKRFELKKEFVKKYKSIKPPFGFNGLGEIVYLRCVSIDTPVLCADFVWRPAGELKVNDPLIAFDEGLNIPYGKRHLRQAIVTHNKIEEANCLGIELENGEILYATPEHPWLAKSEGNGTIQWIQTKDLLHGPRGATIRLPKIMDVWKTDISYEAGYLAAAFDGEASFDGMGSIVFVQTDNEMLKTVQLYLTEKNFKFTIKEKKNYYSEKSFKSNKICYSLHIYGKDEVIRFLGEIRPKRLMTTYLNRIENASLKAKKVKTRHLKIINIFDAGKKDIAVLSTSTNTHFTAGFASHNTYSRLKENGKNESWYETIERVVNGVYNIQKEHILSYNLGWDENKAHESAQEMYDKIFNMKFLPSGRSLWAMGTSIITEKKLFAALNACSFVSTENIDVEFTKPFEYMIDMAMLGVGVGFDTKGAGKLTILKPLEDDFFFQIPDSREGWAESLRLLLNAFFKGYAIPKFDYSLLRPEGAPIKTFGGKSSGYKPLADLHDTIISKLTPCIGLPISITNITDIMNLIGVCVVAGNIRKSAQIVFDYPSEEFLKLKDYKWDTVTETFKGSNAKRAKYGWPSNNTIISTIGMDYTEVAKQTALNGEPGYYWLENAQQYSRLGDPKDHKDFRANGGNPCFSYNTPILTMTGYEKIGDLSNREEMNPNESVFLIDYTGCMSKGKVWKSGNKEIISLIYNLNGEKKEIKCTPDHKFMDTYGNTIEAKDLKGKKIMPLIQEKIIEPENYKYISLGFIQGDGRTNPAPRQITVTAIFGKKDEDIKNIFSTITYDELQNLTFSKSKLPKRDLPDTFENWKFNEQLDFLTGLYTANGSVLKNAKRVTLKTSNYNLAIRIKNILKQFEIDSYITTNKQKAVNFPNGEYICKESYDLNIASFDSIKKFAKKINFVQQYKRDILKEIIIQKSPTIQHIKSIGKEDVYDFTLYNDNHWGVIQDDLIAHNCLEQTLESYEMCCLVETFPTKHIDIDDFNKTLKYAYLFAKTITLGQCHWPETNRVQLRNRRIGTSISGVAQFLEKHSLNTFKEWLNSGYNTIKKYDDIYSEWLAIPRSIKVTSVKPSGTVSLLAGTTPGVHFPESNYYIRRIRFAKNSDLIPSLVASGYKMEEATDNPETTLVVEIPVFAGNCKTVNQVTIWEQLLLASFIQEHWADNQVSCTVTFKEWEKDQIKTALDYFQYKLKGVSFLPKTSLVSYPQMPYEEITKDEYEKLMSNIKPFVVKNITEDSKPELFCDNESCIYV